MQKKIIHWLAGALFLMMTASTNATLIKVDLVQKTSDRWEATYVVTNNVLPFNLESFWIHFDLGLYEDIVAIEAPAGWDPEVFPPDPFLPDVGFYDVFALSAPGILHGDMLGGFVVEFDFLGNGVPFEQFFEVFDPFFAVIDSGSTSINSVTLLPVPIPATLWLFMLGMVALKANKKSKNI
ncbi:hypothetical protein [Candidatus Colwellia aromaticivorans]|uniref:hypothetical protein n=1 Tax=Candidatus Colwellia aromaticivorans TaxID=2267621 RepID=UPI000DF1B24C|nr:hypothetical protein [Candidatus Colwellia aromaticivorans]